MFQRNNKGFTLVEVLLTISLLGIALIPIVQAMPNIYRVNRDMIVENKISFYAQDQLEAAKGVVISNFGTDASLSSQTVPDDTDYRYNILDDGGSDIDGDGDDDIKVITIQIWLGDGESTYEGSENKIELETKISKRPS